MTIVAVVNEKGGTGKTTTATNLSIMRAKKGREVLYIDADQTGSASMAFAVRDENQVDPRITCVQKFGRGISAELLALAKKFDDIVVDAGAKAIDEMSGALNVADVAIIPVQVSQLDLWSLETMDALVKRAKLVNEKLRVMVLLNRASTNPSVRDEAGAIELLNDFADFKMCKTILRDRTSIRRSIVSGLSVTEYTPADPKARNEFESLYMEVFGK